MFLEIVDFRDPQHWQWVLKDGSGTVLENHVVSLDPSDPNYGAFLDLQSYLDTQSSHDNRIEDQLRLLNSISSWIGSKVLGKIADRLANYIPPITIRVLVPLEASGVTYLPLELARVGDQALALREISLVFENADSEPSRLKPFGEMLRILAIFSHPTDVSALALRRERFEFMKLIDRLSLIHRFAIDLRLLQYGVTRDNLREILNEEEGWDLIHVSCHGERGNIIFENSDGTMDIVSSQELAELLNLAKSKLKFISLSSCQSAAAAVDETLRWMMVRIPKCSREDAFCERSSWSPMPSLAQQLVEKLDCAALAMRYPIRDEFAIKLISELYEHILGEGQNLPRALQLSLRKSLEKGYSAASPPLSLVTPSLFGKRAADFNIMPPKIPESEFPQTLSKLTYFPPEPKRFVGRCGPLIRASLALSCNGNKKGILFHGMAGAGKTACALEIAYHYSRISRFQFFVWYKAPDEGKDIDQSLLDLAFELEQQLPGFKMVHTISDFESFLKFLSIFTRILENGNVLIVLDNLESLLTSDGRWKDKRWKLLMDSILAQNGLSRVILTSRLIPECISDSYIILEPIYALSRDESIILAREMPNLGRLLSSRDTAPLVSNILEMTQGHPTLLQFAEGKASDLIELNRFFNQVSKILLGRESQIKAFYQNGESRLEINEILKVIYEWTNAISGSLSSASRTMFLLLCAVEETDRLSITLDAIWPNVWQRLGKEVQIPSRDIALQPLINAGLVEVQPIIGDLFRLYIHPAIRKKGLDEVNHQLQNLIDEEMGNLFLNAFGTALEDELNVGSIAVIYMGLGAIPYLMRRKKWNEVSSLIERALRRDSSPYIVNLALNLLQKIVNETRGTDFEYNNSYVLAQALIDSHRYRDAKIVLNNMIEKVVAIQNFRLASGILGYLIKILIIEGNLEKALELVDTKKEYSVRAGLGPWTLINDDNNRLIIIINLGRYEQVLSEADTLIEKIKKLPCKRGENDTIDPWNATESILMTAFHAAKALKYYERAIDLSSQIVESQIARLAPERDIAIIRLHESYCCIELQEYDYANEKLSYCKNVFEKLQDIEHLGNVFSTKAKLENKIGQVKNAIQFENDAMRFEYIVGNPNAISVSHLCLGIYLLKDKSLELAFAHILAGCVIQARIDSNKLKNFLIISARNGAIIRNIDEYLPSSLNELCLLVEVGEGVEFRKLIKTFPGSVSDLDIVFEEIVKRLRDEINSWNNIDKMRLALHSRGEFIESFMKYYDDLIDNMIFEDIN